MVLPGSKVVTVPSVEVVVVVVSLVLATGLVFVFVDSVVVVLVCAKANGAIAAQARIRMLFFIIFPPALLFCFGLVGFLNRPPGRLRKVAPIEGLDRPSAVHI